MSRLLILLIALLLSACQNGEQIVRPEQIPLIEAEYASGHVVAQNEYEVFAQMDGYVVEKLADDGDEIDTGAPLYTMDTDYEGELEIAEVNLKGRDQNFLTAFRNRNIGFVFQFHYLLPEFTALQNVMIPALKLGRYSREEIEQRAYEKLRILGVKDQALKPTNKLSGGQQQRVAIARALINDPEIVMGDEPTGNLDSHNSHIVFDIFRERTSVYQQTIIAVTHDEEFARKSD